MPGAEVLQEGGGALGEGEFSAIVGRGGEGFGGQTLNEGDGAALLGEGNGEAEAGGAGADDGDIVLGGHRRRFPLGVVREGEGGGGLGGGH